MRQLTKAIIEENIDSYGNSIEKEKNLSGSKEKLIKENRQNSIEEAKQINFKIPNLSIRKNSNKELDNFLQRKIQRENVFEDKMSKNSEGENNQ